MHHVRCKDKIKVRQSVRQLIIYAFFVTCNTSKSLRPGNAHLAQQHHCCCKSRLYMCSTGSDQWYIHSNELMNNEEYPTMTLLMTLDQISQSGYSVHWHLKLPSESFLETIEDNIVILLQASCQALYKYIFTKLFELGSSEKLRLKE